MIAWGVFLNPPHAAARPARTGGKRHALVTVQYP